MLPRACIWVYKQANFSQKSLSPRLLHRLQRLLSSLHFTTACCPGPGFAEEERFFSLRSHTQSTAAAPVPPCSCPPRGPQLSVSPGCPMPSRPLLFLYHLARVHQEDRSSSLAGSRPLLKNVLTNALSVSSQHFDCHRHLLRSILVAQVT